MGNDWVIELSFLVASSKALDLRRLQFKQKWRHRRVFGRRGNVNGMMMSKLIFGGIVSHFSGLVDADGVYTINSEAHFENSCCYLGVSEEICGAKKRTKLT